MKTEKEIIIGILNNYYGKMEFLDRNYINNRFTWKNYLGRYDKINKKYAKAILEKIKDIK